MPKPPSIFEWDVALWRNEDKVTVLPTLARGVYRELLDVMHLSDHSGVITGTREEIARLGRCSVVELDQTLHELKKHRTCEITDRNGRYTLINRKMRREWKERECTRQRVQKHRQTPPPAPNTASEYPCNGHVTPPYKNEQDDKDDKALSSLSLKTLKPEGECKGGGTPPQHHGTSHPPCNGPVTAAKKRITPAQRALAQRLEIVLGHQWVNDAGKWVNRCKANPEKTDRVVAEVESALKENRILETPAQYAEQIWKEFQ